MKVDFNKKYTTVAVYTVITFAVCLLLVVLVQKFSVIEGYLKEIARVLAPVTWGIVIAYIVNPVMVRTEKLLSRLLEKKKKHPKLIRVISVAFSITMLLFIITALIALLLPQVIDSIMGIINNFSTYFTNFENQIYGFFEDYPETSEWIKTQFDNIQPQIIEYVNNFLPTLADLAVKLKDGAVGILIGLKDFLIGFVVAVYLLYSKEHFIAQMRKIVTAFFPETVRKGIFEIASHTNKTLSSFISGKLLDSFIIGILAFICMSIMKLDFVVLMSVVIGVTNVIPFFGPIFGAIPCALLLLVAAPKQVIPFVIFVFILQQFDGNILGPKILGDSTGISAFWVIFAIFIGGGLFGFPGMVLGVPLFAVIYTLVSDLINYILKGKGLSAVTEDYAPAPAEPSPDEAKKENRPNYFEKILKKNPSSAKINKENSGNTPEASDKQEK